MPVAILKGKKMKIRGMKRGKGDFLLFKREFQEKK